MLVIIYIFLSENHNYLNFDIVLLFLTYFLRKEGISFNPNVNDWKFTFLSFFFIIDHS